MFTLAFTIIMALSPAGTSFAANSSLTLERAERTDTAYTLADLAAARLAVYGVLDSRFRSPQEETNLPLSRPEAVRLLWKFFAQEDTGSGSKRSNSAGRTGGKYDNKTGSKTAENEKRNPQNTADTAESQALLTDIFVEYLDALAWASESRIAQDIPADDTPNNSPNMTRREFVSLLLNAMGYRERYVPSEALDFAESIGLAPVGLSDGFTLGDAALYVQCAMGLSVRDSYGKLSPARNRMNIPTNPEQMVFPSTIVLTPASLEDVDPLLREATKFVPEKVKVCGDHFNADEIYDVYMLYSGADGETWYLPRMEDDGPWLAWFDGMNLEELAEAFDGGTAGLYEKWQCCAADSVEIQVSTADSGGEALYAGRAVMFRMSYNEAWELACDADDAFTLYADDTLSRRADQFYQRFVADARNDKEAVSFAKNAINYRADYAAPVSADENGCPVYAEEAHSILGFFRDRRIVCDGYASIFQYLMHRAGLDCVIVTGSTTKADGASDHAWNKVKVNGEWLNMDVCWSDTGYPYLYDLRTDAFYRGRGHWAETFNYL